MAQRSRKPRTVYYRRKREGKTDFRKRLHLLLGEQARLVVRRSNKHTIAQLVLFDPTGDKTVAYATSKDLEKLGWKHSGKNIAGAYLTGLLLGSKAGKIKEAIVDVGLRSPKKGSRLFACVKGAIDAGLQVKASKEVFPPEDRLHGKHINANIANDIADLKKKILKH